MGRSDIRPHETSQLISKSYSEETLVDCDNDAHIQIPFCDDQKWYYEKDPWIMYEDGIKKLFEKRQQKNRRFSLSCIRQRVNNTLVRMTIRKRLCHYFVMLFFLIYFLNTWICIESAESYHPESQKDTLPGGPIRPKMFYSHPADSKHSFQSIISFYRILGNDLPPRHRMGQTLQNLRFILENEPRFPNCTKYWVLNRIVDQTVETKLIQMLELHGFVLNETIIRIPFDVEEYTQIGYTTQSFSEADYFHSIPYLNSKRGGKQGYLEQLYHDKNRYVMNNASKLNSEWIFPFDGNCFLSIAAWNEIIKTINQQGANIKYISIPMIRMTSGNDIKTIETIGADLAKEEPQVIFRYDSQEEYDENMRYGRRSKLELLWRLGMQEPPSNSIEKSFSWEKHAFTAPSPEQGLYTTAGYVFRLFSGCKEQEGSSKSSAILRAKNRRVAIKHFIDTIDETILKSYIHGDELAFYSDTSLQEQRAEYMTRKGPVYDSIQKLVQKANGILHENKEPQDTENLVSLTELLYWMNQENIPRFVSHIYNQHSIRESIQGRLNQIVVLSLAWYFDARVAFADLATRQLMDIMGPLHKEWNINDVDLVPVNITHIPHIIRSIDVVPVLDAIRLLKNKAQAVDEADFAYISVTLANHLNVLTRNSLGYIHAKKRNADGIFWDYQTAGLFLFFNQVGEFTKLSHQFHMRLEGYQSSVAALCNCKGLIPKVSRSNNYLPECDTSHGIPMETDPVQVSRELLLLAQMTSMLRLVRNTLYHKQKALHSLIPSFNITHLHQRALHYSSLYLNTSSMKPNSYKQNIDHVTKYTLSFESQGTAMQTSRVESVLTRNRIYHPERYLDMNTTDTAIASMVARENQETSQRLFTFPNNLFDFESPESVAFPLVLAPISHRNLSNSMVYTLIEYLDSALLLSNTPFSTEQEKMNTIVPPFANIGI